MAAGLVAAHPKRLVGRRIRISPLIKRSFVLNCFPSHPDEFVFTQ
jgi:hypothetical protein